MPNENLERLEKMVEKKKEKIGKENEAHREMKAAVFSNNPVLNKFFNADDGEIKTEIIDTLTYKDEEEEKQRLGEMIESLYHLFTDKLQAVDISVKELLINNKPRFVDRNTKTAIKIFQPDGQIDFIFDFFKKSLQNLNGKPIEFLVNTQEKNLKKETTGYSVAQFKIVKMNPRTDTFEDYEKTKELLNSLNIETLDFTDGESFFINFLFYEKFETTDKFVELDKMFNALGLNLRLTVDRTIIPGSLNCENVVFEKVSKRSVKKRVVTFVDDEQLRSMKQKYERYSFDFVDAQIRSLFKTTTTLDSSIDNEQKNKNEKISSYDEKGELIVVKTKDNLKFTIAEYFEELSFDIIPLSAKRMFVNADEKVIDDVVEYLSCILYHQMLNEFELNKVLRKIEEQHMINNKYSIQEVKNHSYSILDCIRAIEDEEKTDFLNAYATEKLRKRFGLLLHEDDKAELIDLKKNIPFVTMNSREFTLLQESSVEQEKLETEIEKLKEKKVSEVTIKEKEDLLEALKTTRYNISFFKLVQGIKASMSFEENKTFDAESVSKTTSLSVVTVKKLLRSFEKTNIIKRVEEFEKKGRNKTDYRYEINYENKEANEIFVKDTLSGYNDFKYQTVVYAIEKLVTNQRIALFFSILDIYYSEAKAKSDEKTHVVETQPHSKPYFGMHCGLCEYTTKTCLKHIEKERFITIKTITIPKNLSKSEREKMKQKGMTSIELRID